MAIRFYDEAIYQKIKAWVKDPHMRILKPNETTRLFQLTADQSRDDDVKLPLIAISRDSNVELKYPNKKPLSFDGKRIGGTEGDSVQLNGIPVTVSYQIDIYTRRYEEGDEYLRNFIYNIVNYPQLDVDIPYNGAQIQHEAFLSLDSTVTDNSDVSNKLFPDQFTRWTLTVELQDAYLFSIPINKNWSVATAQLDVVTEDLKNKTSTTEEELVTTDDGS